MGPTFVLSATDGPHAGPMNPAIKDVIPSSHHIVRHITHSWCIFVNRFISTINMWDDWEVIARVPWQILILYLCLFYFFCGYIISYKRVPLITLHMFFRYVPLVSWRSLWSANSMVCLTNTHMSNRYTASCLLRSVSLPELLITFC